MPSFQGMGLHRLQIFGTYMRGHNQILHGDQTRREAIFFHTVDHECRRAIRLR